MRMKWLLVCAVLITAVVGWALWGNTAPELTEITVAFASLPDEFDGFRIVQISDLHNAEFVEDIAVLVNSAEPDIIVITGDIVDANHTDIDMALQLVEMVADIAPCYYVTGNHESWIPEYSEMEAAITGYGVTVLHNEKLSIERGGGEIALLGVDDPVFMNDGWEAADDAAMLSPILDGLTADEERFMLLLSHRPELFGLYAEYGIDLAFTGHVHGGQFRLPFVGGLYGPDQGFLPEYDAGLYTSGTTSMVVSRGIGNSVFPIRFNNRPEIVLVELKAE